METKFFKAPAVYVEEVNINVTDLQKVVEFYEKVLGFKVLSRSVDEVVLTADGSKPLLTLRQPANVLPKEKRSTGLYHFALLLPNRKFLSMFLRHIVQIGYPLGAGDHLVSEEIGRAHV